MRCALIIDDYLPTEYFKTLKDAIVRNEHFPWCRINELNVFQTTENRDVYFAHMIYQHHTPKTQEHNWNLVVPFLSQLEKTEKMQLQERKDSSISKETLSMDQILLATAAIGVFLRSRSKS